MALKIAEFVLDTDARELKNVGGPIDIEPLVFDLILFLATHAGRLVSREELIEAVWRRQAVSDSAISTCINSARRALGDSGNHQKFIKTVHGRGIRFEIRPQLEDTAPEKTRAFSESENTAKHRSLLRLTKADQAPIRFFQSYDGASIAHTFVGEGYPLIFSGSWISHLEQDWLNPAQGPYVSHLAEHFTVIRYDLRGNGMSQWRDIELSFDRMVDDLECVIDIYGHDKVAIFGGSQGAAVAIAYATRFPERVSHLILYGGYPRGRCKRNDPEAAAESDALVTLIRQNWASENPAIRQQVTTMFMPDATQEEARWFNEFQKGCAPAENVAQFREVFDNIDVSHLLDGLETPSLIVHSVGDAVAPLSEAKLMASHIKHAEFVMLDSQNHMILENDPEFLKFLHSIVDFVKSQL